MKKTLIGMAMLAIMIVGIFTSCNDDDESSIMNITFLDESEISFNEKAELDLTVSISRNYTLTAEELEIAYDELSYNSSSSVLPGFPMPDIKSVTKGSKENEWVITLGIMGDSDFLSTLPENTSFSASISFVLKDKIEGIDYTCTNQAKIKCGPSNGASGVDL